MPQHRPPFRPRGADNAATSVAVGEPVHVTKGAIDTFTDLALRGQMAVLARGATVAEVRSVLGDAEIQRIAQSLGRRAPSARTIRRWVQQDRIPHADLDDVLDRQRFVVAAGGPAAVAASIGRSESAVRKWMSGRQQEFRGDANTRAAGRQAGEAMVRAGVMTPAGRIKTPSISFWALVEVRVPGEQGYSYTVRRQFNFTRSLGTALPAAAATRLAVAVAFNQTPDVVAILEEHASINYAQFDGYNDGLGFHIEQILDTPHPPLITWS